MFEHSTKYPECPMRAANGNCIVHGGFCVDAVSDEICEVLHDAYYKGYRDGVAAVNLIEAEHLKALKGKWF